MLIGNPWHGVWTPDGLDLPNAEVKTLTTDPAGDYMTEFPVYQADRSYLYPPVYGDCILVKVPDLDVPTTSEAHAALGMEWQNYAFLSGAKRLLAGVELGLNRWIYIDPDSIPWLVEIMFPSSSGNPRRLRFTRFGVFSEAGATSTHYYLTFGANLTQDVYGRWEGAYDVRGHWLCDANATGSKASVSMIGGISTIGVFPLEHLTISGAPGDDLAVSVSPFNDEDFEETPTCEAHSSGTYVVTGGDVYRYYDTMGCRLFAGDDAIRCFVGQEYTVSDILRVSPGTGATTSGSAEGYLIVLAGEHQLNVPFTASVTATYNDTTAEFDAAETIEIESASYSQTTYRSDLYVPLDCITDPGNLYWPAHIHLPPLFVWRRTNNVFEIVLLGQPSDFTPSMDSDQFYSVAIVTPDGITATGERVNKSDDGRYFSYHPITSELLESEAPVCFM